MDPKITMVIPTKNRSLFLNKLLSYHAKNRFKGMILIGDASDPKEFENNSSVVEKYKNDISMRHCQQSQNTSLIEGTNALLKEVKTPYVVLAGDDDYLIGSTLDCCMAFLENHPDYSCACGEQAYVYVRSVDDKTFEIEKVHGGYSKNHEETTPSQRVLSYCFPSKGVNTFSVQRIDNMTDGWVGASHLGLDRTKYHSPLHEIAVNVMSLIQGKQKKFKTLYHVMLRHPYRTGGNRGSWQGDISWLERMCRWQWSEEVLRLVNWWAKAISEKEGVALQTARDIADAVFLQCWIPIMSNWRDSLLQRHHYSPKYKRNSKEYVIQSLRRIAWLRNGWARLQGAKKISMKTLLDKSSVYYNDFLSIQETLTKPV